MIRINLLSSSSGSEGVANPSIDGGIGETNLAEASVIRKEAIKNLFIILIGPLALFAYEQMNIPDMQSRLRALQIEYNEVSEKNIRAQEAVQQTRKLKREQEILQAQINAIESLKKDRSQIVKVMELIQKSVPSNVWLNELDFSMGRLTLMGFSVTDTDLTNFMDALSRSVYFKEVSLVRSVEHNSRRFGMIKRVEISCLLETGL